MRKALIIALVSVAFFPTIQAQNRVPLLDSIVTYKFTSQQDSVPTSKKVYQYNLDGLQVFYGQYSWNVDYKKWGLIESENRVFNQSGYQIEQIDYSLYDRGLGFPYVKQDWEYDPDGNPLIVNKYHKNAEAEEWSPDTKEEFKYDPAGIAIQKLLSIWKTELRDWYPNTQYSFEYNSFGAEAKQYIDFWNSNLNVWSRSSKIETSFYPDGVRQSLYRYRWNSEQNDWTRQNDQWTEFDSQGRLTKEMTSNIGASQLTEYVYDSIGNFIIYWSTSPPWIGDFNPTTKYFITIDENQERKIVDEYRLISESWIPISRTENIFSPLGLKIHTNGYIWADELSIWNLGARSHYYYQSSSSEVIHVVAETPGIFPNPTSGILNIVGLTGPAEVKVYTLQGQLLKTVEQVENTIDISGLPTGVYILNLLGGSKTAVRKMVVKQ